MTPCAQGRCATRLRYAPTLLLMNSILTDFFEGLDSGRNFRPLSPFFRRSKSSVSVFVIKNAKNGKQGFGRVRPLRYENEKLAARKGAPARVFRVISSGQLVSRNFCARVSIFLNPVKGNPS